MGSPDPVHADSFFEALASTSGDAARPTLSPMGKGAERSSG
jgi:hypothetical protein